MIDTRKFLQNISEKDVVSPISCGIFFKKAIQKQKSFLLPNNLMQYIFYFDFN